MHLAGCIALFLLIALAGSVIPLDTSDFPQNIFTPEVIFRDEKGQRILMECREPLRNFATTQGGPCTSPAKYGMQVCYQSPNYQPKDFWKECMDNLADDQRKNSPGSHCCGYHETFGGLPDCLEGTLGYYQAKIVKPSGNGQNVVTGYCHKIPVAQANPWSLDLRQSNLKSCDGLNGNYECMQKDDGVISDDIRTLAKATHSTCCQASTTDFETPCASP